MWCLGADVKHPLVSIVDRTLASPPVPLRMNEKRHQQTISEKPKLKAVVMCQKGWFHSSKPALSLDSVPTMSFVHVPNAFTEGVFSFNMAYTHTLTQILQIKRGADLTLGGVR